MRAGVWLACGVLRAELEALLAQGRIAGKVVCLDSILHLQPEELEGRLLRVLEDLGDREASVVLVYGDCCGRMLELSRRPGVARVDAINCAQLLLGRARYRELMREEAFFLLPEWAPRWAEIMQEGMGLTGRTGREFMQESRKSLVYLDTGLGALPVRALEEAARCTGLPWRREVVGLDNLAAVLAIAAASASRTEGSRS